MFQVELITPEKIIYKGQALSLLGPGKLGLFGILTNHAPLVNALKKGAIKIEQEDHSQKKFEISGGLLEVNKNHVVILADAVQDGQKKDGPEA